MTKETTNYLQIATVDAKHRVHASSSTSTRTWPRLEDPKINFVVPCHNEAKTLERHITILDDHLKKTLPWRYTITVADSGSIDNTNAIATKISESAPHIFVHHLDIKGRGRALKHAWLESTADVVVYVDEDLSTDLTHINELIKPLVRGTAAISIGSRLHPDSQVKRSLKREVISRTYIGLVQKFLHLPITDAQCGFKAMRRDAAQQLLPEVKDDKWFFDTELLWRAHQRGWHIFEMGVAWDENSDSRVNIIQTAIEDIKGIDRLRRETKRFWTLERTTLTGLMVATTLFYLCNLSINGYANSFYSAAVQAATNSWHAFFFASLDSASFITVDKPPVAIWVMAIFTRLFGFSSFTMLLPNALAGITSTYIVYKIVRRHFSAGRALLAGAAMALTPAAILMFRFNNPDSILTLLLVGSVYTFMRALEKHPLRWLSATGILVGTAFNTKMIQALIIVPIYGLVYLMVAKPAFLKRIWHLAVAGSMTTIAALWWPLVVWLTPAASRPYVGSTTDNNIWSLIFDYNGLSRFLGGGGAGMGGGGGGMGGMSGFGGATGILRMFNSDFGPNIAWLIPIAIVSFGLAMWWYKYDVRTHLKRALFLVAGGWLLIHAAVFSMTGGTIHPYYVVVMAPAIAILTGIGTPLLWSAYKSKTLSQWCLPVAVFLSGVTALTLLGYNESWMPWLKWAIFATTTISSMLLIWNLLEHQRRVQTIAITLAIIGIVTGPTIYSLATLAVSHTGSIPTAGPVGTAMADTNNESATISDALSDYLLEHQGSATWIVAVASANESARIQISTNQPVMAIGGFNGSDNTLTLTAFKQLVSEGKVRYFAVSSSGRSGGGGPMSTNGLAEITAWAREKGTTVTYGGNDDLTLYDLSTAA
jgi:4-amino-4-deoxy-L-arabinose transferase-like glycosyltransferase